MEFPDIYKEACKRWPKGFSDNEYIKLLEAEVAKLRASSSAALAATVRPVGPANSPMLEIALILRDNICWPGTMMLHNQKILIDKLDAVIAQLQQ